MYPRQDLLKISTVKTDPQMDPHKAILAIDICQSCVDMGHIEFHDNDFAIDTSHQIVLSSRDETIANQLKDSRTVRASMNAIFMH
jgi:hypothetical protein